MPDIKLENINKYYSKQHVLKNINIHVNDKELVVFLGPSGCGKTTTLNIIAGIEKHDSGKILFDDKNISNISPGNRNIGYVFQNYSLYPNRNVFNNIAFPLKFLKGINKNLFFNENNKLSDKNKIIRIHVEKVAKLLQIESLLYKRIEHLSGGEKQRVSIARAIVKNPVLYLFDEPLSNIDAVLKENLKLEIKMLHNELQSTMIYVTHDQNEAMSLADKIIILNDGEIMQQGTASEIYNHPQNIFVAKFIGQPQINIFEGYINKDNHKLLINKNIEIHFNESLLPKNLTDSFLVGIRPEHIGVFKSEENSFNIKGIIIQKEFLGKYMIYHLKINEIVIKSIYNGKNIFDINEEVEISFDIDKLLFFSN